MAATETLIALAVKEGPVVFEALFNSYLKQRANSKTTENTALKSNLKPNIEATFKKCTKIKTLLNPQSPSDFLSIYATQRFRIAGKDEPLDHYDMVSFIKDKKLNVVLSGTGGSGKSMFTKYLWLSLLEENNGKIPIFIELRDLNKITADSLVVYLLQILSTGQATISKSDFINHLKNGDFVFVFDGFDEVVQSKKDTMRTELNILAESYPETKIIVTSRPDNQFASWQSFHVIEIMPLTKGDAKELVEKADFSEDSKNLFLKRVLNTEVYEQHKSFLSNPLLTSMMLLTFSYNFDIPDKVHLFYQQAFNALYQRHDSYKPGGYQREFHCQLSEDDFKKVISYFCLITYSDQKIKFSRDEVLIYLSRSIKMANTKAEPEKFLADLVNSVCFLIEEGLEFIFPHRSFQEYFCSFCLSYIIPDRLAAAAKLFIKRQNDQVLPLIADMNPENFTKNFAVPFANEHKDKLQLNTRKKNSIKFMSDEKIVYGIHNSKRSSPKDRSFSAFWLLDSSDILNFAALIQRIHSKAPVFLIQSAPSNNFAFLDAIRKKFPTETSTAIIVTAKNNGLSFAFFPTKKETKKLQAGKNTSRNSKQQTDKSKIFFHDLTHETEIVKMFEASLISKSLCEMLITTAKYVEESQQLLNDTSTELDLLFGPKPSPL